ncbi:MAG: TraB/GumN family protein [bacterium]|nr:TraB/GumN family protein [bacterium]
MKIWKRVFIIFIITWAALVNVYGQGKTDSGKSFLWEVDSAAGKHYLLGSIHLLKKEHYPLKKSIEDAFEKTDVLAVEIDLSPDKMMQQSLMLMQKGMYTGEETLKGNLSEKTYQLAQTKLKEMDMDITMFQKFRPWMLAMTITSMKMIKLGFAPTYGIDSYFMGKAAGKKEIAELEGIDFQVKLFDGLSKEENEEFLLSSILEADHIEKEFAGMLDAWVSGDIEKMEKLLTENTQKYPELQNLYKKLLDDRNERMVEKIVTYFKTGKKYLVMVGAAHMVGKKGVVQLLKDKGFKLKQL